MLATAAGAAVFAAHAGAPLANAALLASAIHLTIRIERKAGRHVRGTSMIYDGDSTGSESELEALLGGTTRTLYHNVFAFGLAELEICPWALREGVILRRIDALSA